MPLQSQLHVDRLLTQISIKYKNENYIWDKVFPEVSVKKQTDLYRVFTRDFRIPESRISAKGVANEHDFDVTTNSYALEHHALKAYVSDEDADNYDVGSLRADTTESLSDAIQRRMELSVANSFATSANWSLSVSLSAAQSWALQTSTSNPILFVDTGCSQILNNSGITPNYMILRKDGFQAAKNHVNILDRVKHTSRELDTKILAALFSVDELLIGTAVRDTAAQGLTIAMSSIWPNNGFLGYKPSSPSPLKLSSGYMFKKSKSMVQRWRDEDRGPTGSEAIKVNSSFQAKIVASLTGYLIEDII